MLKPRTSCSQLGKLTNVCMQHNTIHKYKLTAAITCRWRKFVAFVGLPIVLVGCLLVSRQYYIAVLAVLHHRNTPRSLYIAAAIQNADVKQIELKWPDMFLNPIDSLYTSSSCASRHSHTLSVPCIQPVAYDSSHSILVFTSSRLLTAYCSEVYTRAPGAVVRCAASPHR